MVTRIPASEVQEKASRIRLLLTDCDGVLTDAGVYYTARGEEMKRFSMRDGMGVERLRTLAGIRVGILTKESSTIVAARAAKLGISALYTGITDKLAKAEQLARQEGMPLARIAFIGDDVNDVELLRAAGLSACPPDAEPQVLSVVDTVCSRAGGHGAFREFAEMIIEAHTSAAAIPRPSIPKKAVAAANRPEER